MLVKAAINACQRQWKSINAMYRECWNSVYCFICNNIHYVCATYTELLWSKDCLNSSDASTIADIVQEYVWLDFGSFSQFQFSICSFFKTLFKTGSYLLKLEAFLNFKIAHFIFCWHINSEVGLILKKYRYTTTIAKIKKKLYGHENYHSIWMSHNNIFINLNLKSGRTCKLVLNAAAAKK